MPPVFSKLNDNGKPTKQRKNVVQKQVPSKIPDWLLTSSSSSSSEDADTDHSKSKSESEADDDDNDSVSNSVTMSFL
jgi:hypothetical protein